MDSKEATAFFVSDTSSGSSPSSYVSNNQNLLKTSVVDTDVKNNSENGIKDNVSDEEDEGGYVSGQEEFESSSEKLILTGADGEAAGNGAEDRGFDEASGVSMAKVDAFSISGVSDNDSSVEKGVNDDEKDGVVLGKDSVNGSVAIAGSDTNESKVEEVEMDRDKAEKNQKTESLTSEAPATEPNAKGDSLEPAESELAEEGGVKFTSEGDSVVDTPGPGAAVVQPTEEDIKMDEVPVDESVELVGAAIETSHGCEEASSVKITSEGDSVVDTIHVDIARPGVDVVGEVGPKVEKVEVPVDENREPVGADFETNHGVEEACCMELTSEGDSVVDTIKVDTLVPTVPGLVVVGETEEEIERVKVSVDENAEPVYKSSEFKPIESDNNAVAYENDEKIDARVVNDVANGVHMGVTTNDLVNSENIIKKSEDGFNPVSVSEVGTEMKISNDREVGLFSETVGVDGDTNGEYSHVNVGDQLEDGVHKESEPESFFEPHEIREAENEGQYQMNEEADHEDLTSDEATDGMIFGSSEAAKQFIEELERGSGGGSRADSSLEHSQGIDGQIVTDSEEEADTDEEGDGKELFDSAALAALLKAATGADSDSGSITITSQDGSRLFSVERPAGLGSSLRSLRPAPQPNRPNLFTPSTFSGRGESENNLSEEEKKKLEKLQQIRVKFLRLVYRLGLSLEESMAAQVLYRFTLLAGRQNGQIFSVDAAKRMAVELESEGKDDLDFNVNILVLGKSGMGKSATINSIFGEEKAPVDAFETETASVKEISGFVDGVKVVIYDTPGLKPSVMEQAYNRNVLSSVKKFTKKSSPDVVLYVDRLDAQTRDLNDLPLLRTVTSSLGPSIWRSAIVTLTHGASAPPDGPSGTPLSYEAFVAQRSHVVQQSIGQAVGDLRMMSPSLMNPVSLVENHPSCRKNREGQKILPNGQSWRSQLLLLCYSMKILSEASSLSKPHDPFDHRKLFGFRVRSPPLPYMLSSMLQSRAHPKLPSEQGGDNADSDIDLDDFSDSDQEGEDEYDQLPPFKPLRKAQIAKLSKEQRKAYFEEYDYRVKLLQKKQFKDEIRRMKEFKKQGKVPAADYANPEEEADAGAAAPVAVPLPDMALPPSFDGGNPAYRYRFLEPTSQFLARPVLDSHGWDHDCGYDGVNLEHGLAIANRYPAAFTVQITKDKKDFTLSLDSSVSVKHGENISSMAGFDIQSIGKQLAYIVRGETKFKNLKKNKAAGGMSVTFLGENVVPGVKIEDQITLGKQYVLVGSCGAVRSQSETAYGANFELQRKELDSPIGQVQSTLSMSVIKWRGDFALGFNSLAQFSIGRNSKVAVRAGINNKLSGQITVRTSNSENLSLALAAIIPTAISIYRKFWPGVADKYSIY
ncbi:translocase of chloroplast 159, chloroplastic-like [Olea europaea subsp. europaea]|uniref:Translocase of chloroplast 159, chloroplastic-like n=1 Tax=Olea europaea subsp. europaea TaxID=158383 RepID=A0A8S0TXX7_OLEEU|nr:translocase of chloroplast 159, chloroplastic-like [Olea europaea subsp. europaea]